MDFTGTTTRVDLIGHLLPYINTKHVFSGTSILLSLALISFNSSVDEAALSFGNPQRTKRIYQVDFTHYQMPAGGKRTGVLLLYRNC